MDKKVIESFSDVEVKCKTREKLNSNKIII